MAQPAPPSTDAPVHPTAGPTTAPPRNFGAVHLLGTLIGAQVRQLITARKTIALALVQAVPVLAALVYVIFQDVDGLSMFSSIVETVTIPFLVPLAAIFYGGPAIVDEMEGRTLTYLTLRPISKPILFVGKVLAGIAVALPVVLLPMLLLFVLCLWQSSDWAATVGSLGQLMGAAAAGVVVYTSIFAALGAIFASSLIASIVYFVVFEMVFAVLPVLELVSLRFHLRTLAGFSAGDRLGMLDKLVLDQPLILEPWISLAVVLGATALALFGGAWVFKDRQYHV